jgi:hypothetical protein
MTNFTSDFDRQVAGYSPDRLDALVWAATELLVTPMKGFGLFEYYRQGAEALRKRTGNNCAGTQHIIGLDRVCEETAIMHWRSGLASFRL